jgi:hypothetical protein
MMMPRKAGTGELVLVGGESTQMRKASARNWSKAKEQQFLSILADTCNAPTCHLGKALKGIGSA